VLSTWHGSDKFSNPFKRTLLYAERNMSKRRHLLDEATQITCPIVSDTHDIAIHPSVKCDVLLHCGDLTGNGSPTSIRNALEQIATVNAELKLIIAGNHDLSLDKAYYMSEGGSGGENLVACSLVMGESSLATMLRIKFLQEGTYSFKLSSGATFTIYPRLEHHNMAALPFNIRQMKTGSTTQAQRGPSTLVPKSPSFLKVSISS
jgi:hypothetical protein